MNTVIVGIIEGLQSTTKKGRKVSRSGASRLQPVYSRDSALSCASACKSRAALRAASMPSIQTQGNLHDNVAELCVQDAIKELLKHVDSSKQFQAALSKAVLPGDALNSDTPACAPLTSLFQGAICRAMYLGRPI